MQVAVVGAGSWGTAVAGIVSGKVETRMWVRRPELAVAINEQRTNPDYLPHVALSERLEASSDLERVIEGADVVVMAVPSHGFRSVLESSPVIDPAVPIVSLSKGIEQTTLMRMTEVASDVLPGHALDRIGVLTGPNLAREIAAGQPAASVVAMGDADVATRLQDLFMTPTFRVYTNRDVVGAESAGALKNVMAIAAGMAHGLGFGDNTLATLLTRALAELTRLGTAMGGAPMTFAGLAGMGDLVATCMSSQSRNHRVGYGLGQGRTLQEVTGEMRMVAEGVKSTKGILALSARYGVEMPIAEQVGKVLYEGADPAAAVATLMMRDAKAE